MSNSLVQPRTLKGFRDYLPSVMIQREWMMEVARTVYRSYGFVPIETPALEYFEILTGKGSDETDRQMYHFFDQGDRHVGLRFDLTVPLARFVAQHANELSFPFKRYQISPVWRGENTHAGRYREFTQCDFDAIGTESVVADIETICVARDLLAALQIPKYEIRVNSRQILTGLLRKIDAADRSTAVLRALDKYDKLGEAVVVEELKAQANLDTAQIDSVLTLAKADGSNTEILDRLERELGSEPEALTGIQRLGAIFEAVESSSNESCTIRIDTKIARGLDYYTGVVFETILSDLPGIGSVCSGGRYDNLAGTFTKQHLPGIGGSLGLDRLLAALEQIGSSKQLVPNKTVFIAYFDEAKQAEYLAMANILRSAGCSAEVYPDAKKLGQQLKYADARGFPVAIIAGSDELNRGACQLKDLRHKTATEVQWKDNPQALVDAAQFMLRQSDAPQIA